MPTKKNSKLNAADRVLIYQRIEMKDSMSAMARKVGVSTKTVINEIKRNVVSESPMFLSQKGRNLCKKAGRCTVTSLCEGGCIASCSKCTKVSCNEMCPDYEPEPCPLLEKPPYCCNTCHQRFGYGCVHEYHFYDPHIAEELTRKRRSEARQGIDITPEELAKMNELVTVLVKDQGQSYEHVWATHGDELPVTWRTYYNYTHIGATELIPLDLPKAVRFKPRKKAKGHGDADVRGDMEGRLYSDFKELPDEKRAKAVQMDCVKGKKGERPAILTFTWPSMIFQLPFYIEAEDQEHVQEVFWMLQDLLDDDFDDVFEIVLTDRGSSFLDSSKLELDRDGKKRCSVYYCDALRSDQKGSCEREHAELRRIVRKGTSLLKFEKRDMPLIASHMNSYLKPELNFDSPLSRAIKVLPENLLVGYGIELIPPDEVVMKPKLIEHILQR